MQCIGLGIGIVIAEIGINNLLICKKKVRGKNIICAYGYKHQYLHLGIVQINIAQTYIDLIKITQILQGILRSLHWRTPVSLNFTTCCTIS